MDTRRLVEAVSSQPQKCSGHCDQQANLRFLTSVEPLVTCYCCPGGYVSKLMVYGPDAPGATLRDFLTKATGGRPPKEEEIRVATRHSWDSGLAGQDVKAAYWSQNYRGSKSGDPAREALFLCTNCGSAYVKPLSAPGTTCPNCRQ
jgi:hypothetical protein